VKRLLLPILLLAATPARAGDVVDRCIAASAEGQALRDRGQLRAARDRFLECSRDSCPALIRRDCANWLGNMQASIPSVAPRARDAAGRDLADVRLSIDGQPTILDGRAIPLDPGEHLLRFERNGAAPIEMRVLVRQGERDRPVDAVFPLPVRPGPPALELAKPASRSRTGAFIAAGAGAAGLAGFAALGLYARGEVDDMRKRCAPDCAQSRVDGAERAALLANMALAAGVGALGISGWLFFATPTPGGASAGVAARF
jgi:hypothetical protein